MKPSRYHLILAAFCFIAGLLIVGAAGVDEAVRDR